MNDMMVNDVSNVNDTQNNVLDHDKRKKNLLFRSELGDTLLLMSNNRFILAKVIAKETRRGRKGGTCIVFEDVLTGNQFALTPNDLKNLPDWIVDVKRVIA